MSWRRSSSMEGESGSSRQSNRSSLTAFSSVGEDAFDVLVATVHAPLVVLAVLSALAAHLLLVTANEGLRRGGWNRHRKQQSRQGGTYQESHEVLRCAPPEPGASGSGYLQSSRFCVHVAQGRPSAEFSHRAIHRREQRRVCSGWKHGVMWRRRAHSSCGCSWYRRSSSAARGTWSSRPRQGGEKGRRGHDESGTRSHAYIASRKSGESSGTVEKRCITAEPASNPILSQDEGQ